ncbi:unnamed protein product [Candidula unifasciata]|uniref:Thioredoxin domain-containing protein n=1 Tax=Candidula unifasciata TaxID=100452 RepID=A0A8S3ZF47_9EUPU|nr:unnamed protein product [Candidula unifasciata]
MPPQKQDKKKGGQSAPRTDPFIGSRLVLGLTSHNINDFLPEKDIALVMFYDPNDPQCEWSKKHFLKAAKTTVRENHAYAAIDCTQQDELCETEGVTSLPSFKLYSKGKVFGVYDRPREFVYFTMRKFVENAPLLTEPQRPKRPC